MKESKDLSHHDFWNSFIKNGNLDDLSQVYLYYYDFLFDYGRKHTSDIQLVEDTIQNVFISLIKFRKNISEVQNLNGYFLCSFRRQLYLDLDKQKKTILTNQLPEEYFDYFKCPEQDNPENEYQEELYLTIRLCIGDLTAKQQEIIFLRFEREISYEEISKTLNITVDSCYKSVHRSIKIIRAAIAKTMEKREVHSF